MIKGKTNNPNGRPKGKPNRITADLREYLKQLLNDNLDQFSKDFEQLEPKDRLIIMERLLGYILPKLSNVAINEEPEGKPQKTKEDFLKAIENARREKNLQIKS